MVTMTLSRINELAKEVLEIEANSILKLRENIGEDFHYISELAKEFDKGVFI